MRANYLKEMAKAGYNSDNIGTFHRICLPYLGKRFFPQKSSRILDIGAGQGHCIFPLKNCGYENLIAADVDDRNKKLFEDNGVTFMQLDVESDSFPLPEDSFDVILLFHVIEHLKDSLHLLSEVHRMLGSGGVFVLVTPDWRKQYKTFYRDHTHIRPYDKVSIARLLGCSRFDPVLIRSFGVLRGFGRTGIWKFIKPLMFSGSDIIAISKVKGTD